MIAKLINSFVDRCIIVWTSHARSTAVYLLAQEWFWALDEVYETPEALQLTYDSQVGSGLRYGDFGGHSSAINTNTYKVKCPIWR